MHIFSENELKQIQDLQKHVGVFFENQALITQAFTHASYLNENRGKLGQNNERLEFLGDAVLQIVVSRYLYDKFPEMPEGQLSKIRASIVCEPSLVHFSNQLCFGDYIFLGKGEERSGGRTRASLLADLFEAFVGALYLDQGFPAVISFFERIVFPKINEGGFDDVADYKTQLQEEVQKDHVGTLEYKIVHESGPPHNRIFESCVYLNEKLLGSGSGKTKKEAEQYAAKKALDQF